MQLIMETSDINQYLLSSEIVDYKNDNIQKTAAQLTQHASDDVQIARNVYEYVHQNIANSMDINSSIVTYEASDVLKHQHGTPYTKAHLLAALLRCLQIPTGFCYQKLIYTYSNPQRHVIHCLNAIYLQSLNKWIRVDAMGNKEGINAEFSVDRERLSYTTGTGINVIDYPTVYIRPNSNVLITLKMSRNLKDLIDTLPSDL